MLMLWCITTCLFITDPDMVVTAQTLLKISQDLGAHWKNLARYLGFRQPQIDTIEMDHFHYGVQEQAYQMLHKWYQKIGNGAKHGVLAEALINIGRSDLTQYL